MPDPRFGNCRDCAAWMGAIGRCERHPPQVLLNSLSGGESTRWPTTASLHGCWDFIEKSAPKTKETI